MSNDEFGTSNDGYSTNVTFGSHPNTTASSEAVRDISTAEFKSEVIDASMNKPVLVDFWAPWCGPCKQLAPELERAVAGTRGAVKLVKMDIDQHPEIPGQMGIQSIPAVVAFVKGRPADMFMGAKPESEIRAFISKVAGPSEEDNQIEQALEHAAMLIEQGATADAGNIYVQILSVDPENVKAIAGLGHLQLQDNNVEAVRTMIDGLSEELKASKEIVSLLSAIALSEQASQLGDYDQLAAAVKANPDDHRARMDLALALNSTGSREEAAEALLEIIKRQPGWNDDAAKTQLLQFFEAWGLTDDVTVSARRRLSSLLFS